MEPSMTTAAQLGMVEPVGSDLMSTGDDDIAHNARRVAVMYDDLIEDIDAARWHRAGIAPGTDLSTFFTLGFHRGRTSTIVGSLIDKPADVANNPCGVSVKLLSETNGVYSQEYVEYTSTGPKYRERLSLSGVYQPWRVGRLRDINAVIDDRETSESSTVVASDPLKNAMLKQVEKMRRTGAISTAGKTVVCIRADDSYDVLRSTVSPMAWERGLPLSVAVTTGEWTNPNNVGSNYSDLQGLAINKGAEMWHHSPGHSDANTVEALKAALPASLATLKANMPLVPIPGFMTPGVGTSGTGYMGFNLGRTPESWSDTNGGRMILNNHAFAQGGITPEWPLDGSAPVGTGYYPCDLGSQITAATNAIAAAVGKGVAVCIMVHPYRLGTEGYATVDRFATLLDYIAGLRDAGSIEVLTVGGALVADAGNAPRHDLARPAGWVSGAQTITVPEWTKGSVREVSVVSAGAPVTLTATDNTGALNTTRTDTAPFGTVVRMPFTIPLNATTVTITTAGGSGPTVYAI